jgi:hypothetical protein
MRLTALVLCARVLFGAESIPGWERILDRILADAARDTRGPAAGSKEAQAAQDTGGPLPAAVQQFVR